MPNEWDRCEKLPASAAAEGRKKWQSDGTFTISINKNLYDSETVAKTAHLFTDRCYIKLDAGNDEIMVSFKSGEDTQVMLERIVDEFCNELIDQQIRAVVQKESGQIRDLIVKKAFSPIM